MVAAAQENRSVLAADADDDAPPPPPSALLALLSLPLPSDDMMFPVFRGGADFGGNGQTLIVLTISIIHTYSMFYD
jgi:hypothetical protein